MNEFEKLLLKTKVRPEFENPLFGPALMELYEVYSAMSGEDISHDVVIEVLTNRREELFHICSVADEFEHKMPTVAKFAESMRR